MAELPDLIAVDVETTGLDEVAHVVIEVAAVNVRTGEELTFVPRLDADDRQNADPDAFALNRYYERHVYRNALSREDTLQRYERLWQMLRGNTFAGQNPRFDAKMLCLSFSRLSQSGVEESWGHRLIDLSSYAAGVLGENPADPWSLNQVCAAVNVPRPQGDRHTALGDARATAQCLRVLFDKAVSARALLEGL